MAIKKTYDLSVDLKKQRVKANVPVLVQGDTTEFRLRLLDNGKELTSGQISGITGVELLSGFDAQTIIRTVGSMDGSTAVFLIPQGDLFKTGQVKAMVRLTDASDRISTLYFEYQVIGDLTANYVPGEQDVTIFQQYIADAQQKIDEMAATDVQVLSAQLAEKVGKGQVAVSDIDKNKGKFDQTYLSDELLQQIAGIAPVNAVPADGGVTRIKLADNAVDFDKASSDIASKVFEGRNIFPPDLLLIKGKYLTNTGELATSGISNATNFIEVVPDQYYSLPYHSADPGGFYDKDMNFISRIHFTDGVATASANPAVFKTPSSARYIRVNVNVADETSPIHINKFMVVFGKTYPSTKLPYGTEGYNIIVGERQVKDKSISRKHIKDVIKNLFNKNAITSGQYVTNTGTFAASASLGYSEYIPVQAGEAYSVPLVAGTAGAFFDAGKVFISSVTPVAGSTTSFVVPDNAAFVVLNVNTNAADNAINKDRFMLVKSTVYPSKYVPFNIDFLPWLFDLNGGSNTLKGVKWEGKVIDTFGDSITWYDSKAYSAGHVQSGQIAQGYQTHMRSELGVNINNFGVSGNTLVQIAAVVKTKTFANTNGVTITGGVNDWAKGTPIGQIAPIGTAFDTSTSYGALQSAIEYIMSIKPKMKIYLIAPIRGMFKDSSADPLAGKEFPTAYQELMKTVGKLYGLPVCDWYDLTGFNKTNYASFYGDTGATLGDRYIHVGDEGYRRMADILIPFLLNH